MPILDRRVPTDFNHVDKHPLRAALPVVGSAPLIVEKMLNIPRQYRDYYDQGEEGACVGFSQSWMMSILNRMKYDARKLYQEAQLVDEWDDTPPEEGTSLRAAFDILRTKGHWRVYAGKTKPPELVHGILSNKWTVDVDEVRSCIDLGRPVNLGINWYRQFSNPIVKPRLDDDGNPTVYFGQPRYDYWIALQGAYWGPVDGGHAITVVGASDRRQAFALCNTWGQFYPYIVWLPYTSYERLMQEDGETGVVVDR